MAYVQISKKDGDQRLSIVVDGVEMAKHIYNRGFWVEFPEDPYAVPSVHMIVAADALEIDLPDALLEAVVKTDDDMRGESA